MRPLFKGAVAFGLLIGLVAGAVTYEREMDRSYPKPNILVLSLCSLRKAELSLFSNESNSITPNIDRTFRSGLVLDNVYSSFGWTNLALYFLRVFDEKFLTNNGYEVIDDDWRPLSVSVRGDFDNQNPEQIVNHVHPKLRYLGSRISLYRSRPFFAYVHIKYMHYPYIDEVNTNAHWDKYLTSEEKKHVARVMKDPELLQERLPFVMTLSGDPKLLKNYPDLLPTETNPFKIFYGLYNLMVDQTSLQRWSQNDDYQRELSILRKVYRAKLNKIDRVLADVLDLYERKDLLENTIIVLMGDHGEAFMEHNQLGHAMHVYDEILTPPVLVRFPRKWRFAPLHMSQQIYMGSLVDWLMAAVQGHNREEDFMTVVGENPRNEYILSRNCANNIHSVRHENRWKLIVDRVRREKMLFDLRSDPDEKINVYDSHPQIAADLEFYLSTHLSDLDIIADATPCRL